MSSASLMNTDQARSIDFHPEANPARLTLLLLAVVALIIFLVGVGNLAFVDPDEGRYALISWNMVHSGQWLVPTLDQQPYLDKPPLFFWLTAISFKLLGPSEFAARIVPAAGAALTIVVCYLLAGQISFTTGKFSL